MKFQILMATMFRKKIVDLNIEGRNTNANLLVINQADFESRETNGNVTMITCKDRGSSNSRNLAIENSRSEICLIADDDVSFVDDMEKIVVDCFDKYSHADIITFQIVTPEGNLFNPGYPKKIFWHNARSVLRCASIEIAFRRRAILENGLKLDTRFGLGSKYRVHDEVIFLKDALDRGLKLLYIPIPIVIHPAESSGTNFTEHLVLSKGAAFVRLFGIWGVLLNIVFAIKKYPLYRDRFGFFKFLATEFRGSVLMMKELNK